MKKCNCIVLFNEDKTKILFCKRMKDPFKGLYNFVGGKVEKGEDDTDAAYRELYEETGISPNQVRLFRLMDITYYSIDFVLEMYVGKLNEKVNLVEEANPLVWLPLTENFADSNKFAGQQNIAHIINIALQFPLDQPSLLDETSRCIGVDGCRGGWIAAVIDNGRLKIEKYTAICDITEKYPTFDEFLLDMPIGLPSNKTDTRPDDIARRLIAPRTSTIFPVPCKKAIYADAYDERIRENVLALGKSITPLTNAIIPKMREVDEFLCGHIQYKNKIKESHPEVCFAGLNGSVVMSRKSTSEGLTERLQILRKYLPQLSETEIKDNAREYRCNEDDVVDAICLAVVANLCKQGKTAIIPENPSEDIIGT